MTLSPIIASDRVLPERHHRDVSSSLKVILVESNAREGAEGNISFDTSTWSRQARQIIKFRVSRCDAAVESRASIARLHSLIDDCGLARLQSLI